jgi:hypothetical protein
VTVKMCKLDVDGGESSNDAAPMPRWKAPGLMTVDPIRCRS